MLMVAFWGTAPATLPGGGGPTLKNSGPYGCLSEWGTLQRIPPDRWNRTQEHKSAASNLHSQQFPIHPLAVKLLAGDLRPARVLVSLGKISQCPRASGANTRGFSSLRKKNRMPVGPLGALVVSRRTPSAWEPIEPGPLELFLLPQTNGLTCLAVLTNLTDPYGRRVEVEGPRKEQTM